MNPTAPYPDLDELRIQLDQVRDRIGDEIPNLVYSFVRNRRDLERAVFLGTPAGDLIDSLARISAGIPAGRRERDAAIIAASFLADFLGADAPFLLPVRLSLLESDSESKAVLIPPHLRGREAVSMTCPGCFSRNAHESNLGSLVTLRAVPYAIGRRSGDPPGTLQHHELTLFIGRCHDCETWIVGH